MKTFPLIKLATAVSKCQWEPAQIWYNVLFSLEKSGFAIVLGIILEISEVYSCSYKMPMGLSLLLSIYLTAPDLQLLNQFLFPLSNLLRKYISFSHHFTFSPLSPKSLFLIFFFFFIPLSGLPSLKDFLALLRLHHHAFSIPFGGNCDLLWCYIHSKANILYLNLLHLIYALS